MSKKVRPQNIQFAVLAIDAVIFSIIDRKLHVLLGEVTIPEYAPGTLGLIGGLINPNETADDAVSRHLLKKANIGNVYFEQLYTFSSVDRDPRGRVVSVAYNVLTHKNNFQGGSVKTQWVPVHKVKKLAYDHKEILRLAVHRLQSRIGYTSIARFLLPATFTLTDLQEVYEIILDREFDKRNFRKKVLAMNFVEKTGKKTSGQAYRPADLYRFGGSSVRVIEII